MSERDVLNKAPNDPLNPDYGWDQGDAPSVATFKPRNGPRYSRRLDDRGQSWTLTWANRNLDTKRTLQQWARRFEHSFFAMADYEYPDNEVRFYSGYFNGPLTISPAGFEKWTVKAQFQEEPGRALYRWPVNWGRDAIVLDDLDDNGVLRWSISGIWTKTDTVLAYGGDAREFIMGSDWQNNVADDSATMGYFGYGFRVLARTGPDLGIMAVYLDGTLVDEVDLYTAAPAGQAPQLTKVDVPLGFHRVKLVCTGTKNALASDCFAIADALEVMR